jgi:tartrate-resistant acid phosphatase type 5
MKFQFSPETGGSMGAAATPVRFAFIGDFGSQNGDFPKEGRVPEFVKNWEPDFIVSLGDSAYSDHNDKQNAFELDVWKFYQDFIEKPADDPEGKTTRFFPAIGNHDYHASGGGVFPPRFAAYKAMFAVPAGPGGHHFYEFARGPVRFFVLDSNQVSESDGWKKDSAQWKWFDERIANATEPWKLGVFHHSPYHSAKKNEKDTWMREWNFETRGLTAVLAGHSHVYERAMKGSFPFFTNGIGGNNIVTAKDDHVVGSTVIYDKAVAMKQGLGNKDHGAILAEATAAALTLEFWTVGAVRQDRWPGDAPNLTRQPQPVP